MYQIIKNNNNRINKFVMPQTQNMSPTLDNDHASIKLFLLSVQGLTNKFLSDTKIRK